MSATPDAVALSSAQTLQMRFCAHLRAPTHEPIPDGIEARRIGVYRDLVYANMEGFIAANFPVIRGLYDDAAWQDLARAFVREHRCHTPLFPEFSREFLRWLESRAQEQRGDPPFLLELAHYEWAELALAYDEASVADVAHDRDGDLLSGVPVVSPLVCVLGYRFPVHTIRAEFQPHDVPDQPTLLMLVRGRDDLVRFHEINALTALLIERLQHNEGDSGSACVNALLDTYPAQVANDLRAAGYQLLHQLFAQEAILGTRP